MGKSMVSCRFSLKPIHWLQWFARSSTGAVLIRRDDCRWVRRFRFQGFRSGSKSSKAPKWKTSWVLLKWSFLVGVKHLWWPYLGENGLKSWSGVLSANDLSGFIVSRCSQPISNHKPPFLAGFPMDFPYFPCDFAMKSQGYNRARVSFQDVEGNTVITWTSNFTRPGVDGVFGAVRRISDILCICLYIYLAN